MKTQFLNEIHRRFKNIISIIIRFGQDDAISGATAWLAMFTLFLVVETYFSVRILQQTDTTLHGTFFAGNRAWITVQNFDLVGGTLAPNVPVEFRMIIKNGGGEPANYVFKSFPDYQIVTRAKEDLAAGLDWWSKGGPEEHSCKENQLENSYRTLLHGEANTVTQTWKVISNETINQFSNALATFYIRGCLKYQTLGSQRITQYCYYFNTQEADGTVAKEDLAALQCPKGNHVD